MKKIIKFTPNQKLPEGYRVEWWECDEHYHWVTENNNSCCFSTRWQAWHNAWHNAKDKADNMKEQIEKIINDSACAANVSVEAMKSRSRQNSVVFARQLAMSEIRRLGLTYKAVGDLFDLDHATAYHACVVVDTAKSGKDYLGSKILESYSKLHLIS